MHKDSNSFRPEEDGDQPPGAPREFWFGLAHALALTPIIAVIGVALWMWLA